MESNTDSESVRLNLRLHISGRICVATLISTLTHWRGGVLENDNGSEEIAQESYSVGVVYRLGAGTFNPFGS